MVVYATLSAGAQADSVEQAQKTTPIRFGLTAVVVRENLRFLDQWAYYLSQKMGQPVEFVRRRSYREVMDMLESGSLDFAWICGFPYVQNRNPEFIKLLSVPIYKGNPLYHSFIIVHRDSPHQSLEDLKGKTFAYSDPESNSGFLYPQYLLSQNGTSKDTYFRQTFFTFNHAETVEAVAERFADGGAVDSYIWEYMKEFSPDIADKTKVINRSPAFGFPPLVARLGVNLETVWKMERAIKGMNDDPDGSKFLNGLKLDRFGEPSASLFDNIREMVSKTRNAQPKANPLAQTQTPANSSAVRE
jgi:phosphonate transport system substrate-binding protein